MGRANNKKDMIRKTRYIIVMTAMLVLFALYCTVSAWVTHTRSSSIIGDVNVTAAKINATYEWNVESVIGIPGETATAQLTVKDVDSTRDFVFQVILPDNCTVISDELGLGAIEKGKPAYGIVRQGEASDPIDISIYFWGAKVIAENNHIMGTPYDGNETQTLEFDLSDIEILYCQATPEAVMDVFGLNVTDADKLLAGEVG